MRKEHRSTTAFKQAFLDLIKTAPIEKITVSQIVQQADYTRSAFYARFPSLGDFYNYIVDSEVENYMNISKDTYSQAQGHYDGYIVKSLVRLFEYVYANRELYRFIFTNYNFFNAVDRFYNSTSQDSQNYVVNFIDDYPDINLNLYSYLSSYVQKGAIKWWIDHNFEQSPQYMAEQVSLFYVKQSRGVTYIEHARK